MVGNYQRTNTITIDMQSAPSEEKLVGTITFDPAVWDNGKASVTMHTSTSYTIQYQRNGILDDGWQTGSVATNLSNGDTLYARLTNGEQYSEIYSTYINNTTTPNEKLVGTIEFEPAVWENGKASVVMSTTTNYAIQYQVNGISNGNWKSGAKATGLNNGDTLYARLTNGEQYSEIYSTYINNTTHNEEVQDGWTAIYTADDLKKLSEDLNGKYILMDNIELPNVGNAQGSNWTSVGSSSTPFKGTLDGNNYKISNLQIGTSTTSEYQGLFGYLGQGSTVKNLTIETTETGINGSNYIGTLAGYNYQGTITNVSAKGNVKGTGTDIGGLIGHNECLKVSVAEFNGNVTGGGNIGGLIGYNRIGTIEDGKTSGKVILNVSGSSSTYKESAGGLVGYNYDQTITKCYSSSDITLSSSSISYWQYIGGLVGYNYDNGTIEKSAATGNVIVNGSYCKYVGGLVGYNYQASSSSDTTTYAKISDCYSTGDVSANSSYCQYVGGLVGRSVKGVIENTYTISKVKGYSDVGGLVGYASDTETTNSYWTKEKSSQTLSATGEVKTLTWLINKFNLQNKWDFTTTWGIENNRGLPYLNGITIPDNVYIVKNGYVTFEDGNGTEQNPYIIRTEGELNRIRDVLDAYYILDADITLSPVADASASNWTAVGSSSEPFIGHLNGNNHTIKNLQIGTSTSSDYQGLFGYLGEGSTVEDLTIETTETGVNGGNYVGILSGYNKGLITNATIKGNVKGKDYVGGLIGYNSSLTNTLKNLTVIGNITGTAGNIGGLIGYNISGSIQTAKVIGNTTGKGGHVGGLIGGTTASSATFTEVTVEGNVTNIGDIAYSYTGGLIGYNSCDKILTSEYKGTVTSEGSHLGGLVGYNIKGTIEDGKTSGKVILNGTSSTYKENVGGLVGYNNGQTITKCYSNSDISLYSGNVIYWRYIGGLVGQNYGNATIEKSAATGNVIVNGSYCQYVGGLVGYNYNSTSSKDTAIYAKIIDCYSTGNVSANTSGCVYVGGLVGYSTKGVIKNTYTVSKVTGYSTSGGLVGGAADTEATNSYWTQEQSTQKTSSIGEAKTLTWLMNKLNLQDKWNFTETWGIESTKSLPYINGITIPEDIYVLKNGYTTFKEGNGTEENPYIIRTEEQLNRIRDVLNAYYRLEEDITLTSATSSSASNWIAAGNDKEPFTGHLNGNNHTIKNLQIGTSTTTDYQGLFGYLGESSTVQDLTIETTETGVNGGNYVGILSGYNKGTVTNITVKGNVKGKGYVGGLIGENYSSSVLTNMASEVTVTGTEDYAGGLIGKNKSGNIQTITQKGNVTGKGYVGGLIGYNISGNIQTATVIGNTTGKGSYVGGLIGENTASSATLTEVTVEGNVTNKGNYDYQYTGGLIGDNSCKKVLTAEYKGEITSEGSYLGGLIGNNGSGTIEDAKTSGKIILNGTSTGNKENVGGLVGYNNGQTITKCYSNSDISLYSSSVTYWRYIGGLVGQNKGNATIEKSAATGDVLLSGTYCQYVGGLVGYNYQSSSSASSEEYAKIINCYSTGNVSANSSDCYYIGGLVGYSEKGVINNSYTISKVTGTSNKGGLVGYSVNTTATDSYWTKEKSTQTTSTVGEEKTVTWLINKSNLQNKWDFETIWGIDDRKSLPYLNEITIPDEIYVIKNGYVTFTEGQGTEQNPYIIRNERELNRIRDVLDAYYRLEEDIILTPTESTSTSNWTAVGNKEEPFKGHFDGNNHAIRNLQIGTSTTTDYQGLFGYLGKGSTVKDLTIETSDTGVNGGNYVGILAGYNEGLATNITVRGNVKGKGYVGGLIGENNSSSVLTNMTAEVTVTGTGDYAGGLIGKNKSGNIQTITQKGNVTGIGYVGGLIGLNSSGNIETATVIGNTKGSGNSVGGLIGDNSSSAATLTEVTVEGDVTNTGNYTGGLIGDNSCKKVLTAEYKGTVTGGAYIGGLIGYNRIGTIEEAKTSGKVILNGSGSSSTYKENAGGLVGYNNGQTITKCYSSSNISSSYNYWRYIGGLVGHNNGKGIIEKSAATGDVLLSGTYSQYIGGLVGYNYQSSSSVTSTEYAKIEDCYSTGNVSANGTSCSYIGGLVGYSDRGIIKNTYTISKVTGTSSTGGLAGYVSNTTTTYSYWTQEQSGQQTSTAGEAQTISWLKTKANLTDKWDFTETWGIVDGKSLPYINGITIPEILSSTFE